MSSQPKAITVVAVVSLAVTLGVIAFAWPSMLGWVTVIAFGGVGLAFVRGAGGVARRRTSVAFGVFMLACAARFGTSFGALALPRWFGFVFTLMLMFSVAWFIFESRHAGAGSVRET
jgi:hypothetical protein